MTSRRQPSRSGAFITAPTPLLWALLALTGLLVACPGDNAECAVSSDCPADEACSPTGTCVGIEAETGDGGAPLADAGPVSDAGMGGPDGGDMLLSLRIDPVSSVLAQGTADTLTATATYSQSGDVDVTEAATWTSDAPEVVSVSDAEGQKGTVQALSDDGTVTVRALFDDFTATAVVDASAAALVGLTVLPASVELVLGQNATVFVEGIFSNGQVSDVTEIATYASLDPAVCVVSEDGVISAIDEGVTNVVASVGALSANTAVTVTAAQVVSIAVTPTTVSLVAGETADITVSATLSDNAVIDYTAQAQFSSTDPSIAALEGPPGRIRAMTAGSTSIVATAIGVSPASTSVLVTPPVVRDVSTRNKHVLVSRSDGVVLAWGWNDQGQLARDDLLDRSAPVVVDGLPRIVKVAAGGQHSLALDEFGNVWGWGLNSFGELGRGTHTPYETVPQKVVGPGGVGSLSGIVDLRAGLNHTVALDGNGNIYHWGQGGVGQAGDGTTGGYNTPTVLPAFSGVKAIAAGAYNTAIIDDNDEVWIWGWDCCGQLGNDVVTTDNNAAQLTPYHPDKVWATQVVEIDLGWAHLMVRRSTGTVYAVGWNAYGQLGDGTVVDNADAAFFGFVDAGQIASAFAASYYIDETGAVFATGLNSFGQLGLGDTNNQVSAAQVHGVDNVGFLAGVEKLVGGGDIVVALTTGNRVLAWGSNVYGEVGNSSADDVLFPIELVSLSP